jgi:integrase
MSANSKDKRRQRGSGSIFRKPPCKNWVIQYYVNGKRKREATGSTDYDFAKKLLRQRMHEIDKNEYVARHGKPARVQELYDTLLEHNLNNHRGRKRELPGRWKHLQPVLGHLQASAVTTDDIRGYIRNRQVEEAKDATINRELATLKRMYKLALQSTPPKVQRMPHIPMLRENNVRTGFVEDADFARLASEAGELWLRTFLELAFTYGWRRGELLGLRVEQVNLPLGTIRLDPGTTKNREGREVVMTPKVAALLREAVAGKSKSDYVLTRKGGAQIKDFRTEWRNLCCRAGLGHFECLECANPLSLTDKKCEKCGSRKRSYKGLNPHDMRRSAAKAARAAGIPESVVMAMGGWKTAAMFRRYAIVSSADQRAAADALEQWRAKQAAQRAEKPTAPFTAPEPQKRSGSSAGTPKEKLQ